MTADLVAFLRARLDEDEQTARAATPGPWRHSPDKHWRKPGTSWFEEAVFAGPAGSGATCIAGTGETDDQQSMADAAHIARHDPARVLAEVDAMRRTLVRCEEAMLSGVPVLVHFAEETVRELALPWAGHPDFPPDA